MKIRAITSVVIIISIVPLILFSHYFIYPIILAALGVTAVYELLKVIGVSKKIGLTLPAYLFAAAFPVIPFFTDREFTKEIALLSGEDSIKNILLLLAGALLVYLFYLMGAAVFSKGKVPFSKIAEIFTTVTYVVVSFTSLSIIRYFDKSLVGMLQLGLVFIVAWICDVFAYLVGSLFGKHKLIPEVSPKKTVEGSIGGIVFAAFAYLLYGFIVDKVVDTIDVNYLFLGIFGTLLSVVSQIGDLIASLIKREYGVKDYGKLFPGHGGVMDRFDSVLAVSSILLILCLMWPPFTTVII